MPTLFTIGYAAHTPESLIALLRSSGVSAVADVRANASSRKPGFSKRRLEAALNEAAISYQHWPALGIPTADRAHVTSAEGWSKLLDDYRASLDGDGARSPEAARLAEEVKKTPTALLCLETDLDHCHRKPLSEWLHHHTAISVEHL